MAGQLLGKAILLCLVFGLARAVQNCQKNFPDGACPEGQFCGAPGQSGSKSQFKCYDCPCDDITQCYFNSNNDIVCNCTGTGYTGPTCSDDIDECASSSLNNCSPNALCTNTDGSFTCTCNLGYTGNGVTCDNINECMGSPPVCPAGYTCQDQDPGFCCTP